MLYNLSNFLIVIIKVAPWSDISSLQGMGEPDDVGKVAQFLASKISSS